MVQFLRLKRAKSMFDSTYGDILLVFDLVISEKLCLACERCEKRQWFIEVWRWQCARVAYSSKQLLFSYHFRQKYQTNNVSWTRREENVHTSEWKLLNRLFKRHRIQWQRIQQWADPPAIRILKLIHMKLVLFDDKLVYLPIHCCFFPSEAKLQTVSTLARFTCLCVWLSDMCSVCVWMCFMTDAVLVSPTE